MRANHVLLITAFLIACLMFPLAAQADGIRVTIEGAKQGHFKGDNPAHEKEGISALKFSQEIGSPRDAATGVASGKRQHKPIVITKLLGPSSPELFEAIATNEVLKTVLIEFSHSNAGGGLEVYYTVKLTNASISSIRQYTEESKIGMTMQLEEVSLTFQKIEVQHLGAKTTGADDWSAR